MSWAKTIQAVRKAEAHFRENPERWFTAEELGEIVGARIGDIYHIEQGLRAMYYREEARRQKHRSLGIVIYQYIGEE